MTDTPKNLNELLERAFREKDQALSEASDFIGYLPEDKRDNRVLIMCRQALGQAD